MADVLKTFPDSESEALAMLYVQNQDIRDMTPEQLAELYWNAYYRIDKHSREVYKDIRNSYR